MERVGYQIPHLKETLVVFFSFVVTSQLPGDASFQVWLPSAAHLASWAKSALDGARTPSGNV